MNGLPSPAPGKRLQRLARSNLYLVVGLCVALAGCGESGHGQRVRQLSSVAPKAGPAATRFEETVHQPEQSLGLTVAAPSGVSGETTRIACATCHGLLEASPAKALAKHAEGVHAAIKVTHGDLTCRSCHVPPTFESFRLVSGETAAYSSVMRLCAQCHGDKWTDFQHGAHGGMNGHWDLNRGPRVRNHCLDCHDAHAPAIRPMWPARPPRTRGAESVEEPTPTALNPGGAHAAH